MCRYIRRSMWLATAETSLGMIGICIASSPVNLQRCSAVQHHRNSDETYIYENRFAQNYI